MNSDLEDRVERQQLQAGDLEQPALTDPLDDVSIPGGAPVAVRDRRFDELAGGVEQSIVDRPGVDADRRQWPASTRRFEAVLHLGHEPVPVPSQRPVGIGDGVVGVAVDDLQLGFGDVEVDPAHPDRRRPEVNRRNRSRHRRSARPRPGGGAGQRLRRSPRPAIDPVRRFTNQ